MRRNKITRKILAGAMAVGLMAASALPAYATETDAQLSTEKEMEVIYKMASSFTLTIPETVTLSNISTVTKRVSMQTVNVGSKEKVQVKVKSGISDGKVTLTDKKDASNTCTSVVSLERGAATGIADDAVVAEFEGNSTTAVTGGTLCFSKVSDVLAGEYTGSIVFEASIVAKE